MEALKKLGGPGLLICLAAFLLPILGGQVSTDLQFITPGTSGFSLLWGSADAPLLGQLILVLLVAGAIIWGFASRRVVQIPFAMISLALIVFMAIAAFSTVFTPFKPATYIAALQFIFYAIVCFSALSLLGRGSGPRIVAISLFAGVASVAAWGILEYAQNRSIDPNWRIFSTWVNPNALAGMLLIGIFVGFGLWASCKAIDQKALVLSGVVLIGLALFLTQSKGGILAAGVGAVLLLAAQVFFARKAEGRFKPILVWAAAGLCIAALSFATTRSSVNAAPGSAPRIAQADSTQEQSQGFRTLLWRSSIELAKMNPLGWGPGTFRYESTRPGLVPSTHLAHQGFLQLLAEMGFVGLGVFVVFLLMWLLEMFRGKPESDLGKMSLKAGVFAAVAASLAHNMVDSDLQHMGTGAGLFLLLGLGLQLSVDAVTPEVMPRPIKSILAGMIALHALLFSLLAWVDTEKSAARGLVMTRQPADLRSMLASAKSVAPFDGEIDALMATSETDQTKQIELLKSAAYLSPTMRNNRNAARAFLLQDNFDSAVRYTNLALERDPANLFALKLLLEIELKRGENDAILTAADRLIEAESTTPFQVRAIPESIPTETLYARLVKANHVTTEGTKATLAKEAIQGYAQYADKTWPLIKRGAQSDPNYRFAGDGLSEARTAFESGLEACRLLEEFGSEGDKSFARDEAVRFNLGLAEVTGFFK